MGVVEGLVTTNELGTTGLLVTLLVGVLMGNVEAGVDAD